MAITIADLILFNNVESTDLVQGALQLPYFKPITYIPNVTYSNGYEQYVNGGENGRGTQVLMRELGKGAATHVKANTAGAFKYTHAETPDTLVTIPLDDVFKQSEEIYEAVDLARTSATGARKFEIVINNIIELSQKFIGAGLVAAANAHADTTPTTAANVLEQFIDIMGLELDYLPTVAVVSPKVYTELLKLTVDGSFIPAIKFDTIRTGIVGQVLGVDIYVDKDFDADIDFVLYNHNFYSVFNVLEFFDAVQATDFNGSYARGLMLQGTYGPTRTVGNGAWGVVKKNA